MRWLVSDWDSRDPKDDLHDIECGKYLQALQDLPQGLRQLHEDANMHVELTQIGDNYRVTKIVKKRESEFLQGKENYFVFDSQGKRIPLTEEEYDKLLGIKHNPEDIYYTEDIDLETIGSEHTAPMDVWDITYDASKFVNTCTHFIKAWNEGRISRIKIPNPYKYIDTLRDELIYSADWFPYAIDKRIHSARARQIAADIKSGNIVTKQQLGAAIGPRTLDKRPEMVRQMRCKAAELPTSKRKAAILVRAQKVMSQVYSDRRTNRNQSESKLISNADRAKLWSMWRDATIHRNGAIKLMSWQFERTYRFKLQGMVQREEITRADAERMFKIRMAEMNQSTSRTVGTELNAQQNDMNLPKWLQSVADVSLTTEENSSKNEEDYDFACSDWLLNHAATEFTNNIEEEYVNAVLLDEGEQDAS